MRWEMLSNIELKSIENSKKVVLDLSELEKATVIYDSITDSLHIVLSNEEADETILLENNIIVKLNQRKIISLTIQDVLRGS
uniref:DUF2283 domain-containing protein n=1 Tax=Ignisphaera aggregans TaxID=334771 RepID=A0A7C5YY40_9CREN